MSQWELWCQVYLILFCYGAQHHISCYLFRISSLDVWVAKYISSSSLVKTENAHSYKKKIHTQKKIMVFKTAILLQVNLCQKLLYLHQLTHNMTTDCTLNYKFKTWKFQAQTWGEHVVYRNYFWHSEQFMYKTYSEHVLSLQFSCTELVILWAICHHIVG